MTQFTDTRARRGHSPGHRLPATGIPAFRHSGIPALKDMIMKPNVGCLDRRLRIDAGLTFPGLAATGTVGAWGWIGVVPRLTELPGFCPD